jgi:hypothetical protein
VVLDIVIDLIWGYLEVWSFSRSCGFLEVRPAPACHQASFYKTEYLLGGRPNNLHEAHRETAEGSEM